MICAMRSKEQSKDKQTSGSESQDLSNSEQQSESTAIRVNIFISSRSCNSESQNFYQNNHL